MFRILSILLTSALACFSADPFVGTWKPADLGKWKISNGTSVGERKSRAFTLELVGKNSYRETVTALDGATSVRPPSLLEFNSDDHLDSNNVTNKGQRIDDRHLRQTYSSSKGRLVEEIGVSPNGKTLTLTRRGTGTITGRPVDELFVYERQPDKAK